MSDLPTVKTCVGLIEDNLSVRRAVNRLLRAHGYLCTSYGSAEAALSDPAIAGMDCIVVDVQLGGMSGVEFCRRLGELEMRIPCVFITAHADSELPVGWVKNEVLIKPFEEGELIASIKYSIGPCQS